MKILNIIFRVLAGAVGIYLVVFGLYLLVSTSPAKGIFEIVTYLGSILLGSLFIAYAFKKIGRTQDSNFWEDRFGLGCNDGGSRRNWLVLFGPASSLSDDRSIRCPNCGRSVKVDCNVCPHCNYEFNEKELAELKIIEEKQFKSAKLAGLIIIPIILVIVAILFAFI